MRHNDTQLGIPQVPYSDDKSTIQSLAITTEGMVAYATVSTYI